LRTSDTANPKPCHASSADGSRDRAATVAVTLCALIAQRGYDPALQAEIAALLREEFLKIEQQVLTEIRVD